MSANYQTCLEHNLNAAQKCGANDQQLAGAMEAGHRVRKGAAAWMDAASAGLPASQGESGASKDPGCNCGP